MDVARIRIDDDAAEKLERAADVIGATKSGLASEIISQRAIEIINDEGR